MNGELKITDDDIQKRVESAEMLWIPEYDDGYIEGWDKIHNFPNVLTVMDIVTEETWNKLFFDRTDGYKYKHFLRAVA